MRTLTKAAIVLPIVGLAVAGCNWGSQPTSTANDQKVTNTQLDRYQKNQPVPQYDWSQYRQTVIDVENARVHGVATTTFFFNMGAREPFKSCPSIGFPVPSTAQLTNPDQVVAAPNTSSESIGQAEPNGTYTGESSGTYVVCVAPSGTKYVTYWEGFVHTEGGAAHWDEKQGVVLDGEPTVKSKSK
jgi:hypothetical protein